MRESAPPVASAAQASVLQLEFCGRTSRLSWVASLPQFLAFLEQFPGGQVHGFATSGRKWNIQRLSHALVALPDGGCFRLAVGDRLEHLQDPKWGGFLSCVTLWGLSRMPQSAGQVPKWNEWTAHEHEGVCVWVLLLSFQWYRTADTNFNLAPGGCTSLTFPCPRLFCIHSPPATPAILCCAGKGTRQGESPGCLIRLKYSFMYQGRSLERGSAAANRLQVLTQIRQEHRTPSCREIQDEGLLGSRGWIGPCLKKTHSDGL